MECQFQFEDFRVDSQERLLTRSGSVIPIAPKPFDALLLLLENAGALVNRTTLRERLWSDAVVEESTLARVIADLRKALGEVGEQRRYIETVPKFGYRFIAPVVRVPRDAVKPSLFPPVADEAISKPIRDISRTRRSPYKWALAAAALTILGLVSATAFFDRRGPQNSAQSLLIAPFQIIGGARDSEALQFGLQDSLTTALRSLSELSVRALKPNLNPMAVPEDVVELGRRYHVDVVLTGTIQFVADRIRVSVRLLRSATGQVLWSGSFEERSSNLFRIESLLAERTVAELVPTLSAKDSVRLARRFPSNAEANRYYLLGLHYWNQRDDSAYAEAIEMFSRAAEADPSFASAYTGMADSYLLLGNSQTSRLTENVPRAKMALEKALKINPDLGEAYATLGLIAESVDFDWQKAEREFQMSIRLAPNYATAHHWYAEFLTMMGRFDDAEREFSVAQRLDPVSPIILTDMAQLYNFRKDYPRSLQILDSALKLDPAFYLAHERKGIAWMMMRRSKEALEEFREADRGARREPWIGLAAWAAAVERHRQEGQKLARQAEEDRPNAFLLAVIWTELGDFDRANLWIERAYEARVGGIVSLKVNPFFTGLQSDARFQAVLRRMKLI